MIDRRIVSHPILESLGEADTEFTFNGKRLQARPLLDEICYDPAQRGEGEGSESWAVVNCGERRLKLDGWSLTDNEGQWFFQ